MESFNEVLAVIIILRTPAQPFFPLPFLLSSDFCIFLKNTIYVFIDLAASGLGCRPCDCRCIMQAL